MYNIVTIGTLYGHGRPLNPPPPPLCLQISVIPLRKFSVKPNSGTAFPSSVVNDLVKSFAKF